MSSLRNVFLSLTLATILALPFFSSPSQAMPQRRPSFAEEAQNSVGALFAQLDDKREFTCTGFVVGATANGLIFLTAAHCMEHGVFRVPQYTVTFSPNEGGPYYGAVELLVSQTEDVAVLQVVTEASARRIPTLALGDETKDFPGDRVSNVTYGEDLGRNILFGEFVNPRMPHYSQELLGSDQKWHDVMWANIPSIPGSSGSPLFDEKQHAVIGIVVGHMGSGGSLVVPISAARAVLAKALDK